MRKTRKLPSRALLLIAAILTLTSCSVGKLKDDMAKANAEYGYIAGSIDNASNPDTKVYIALFKKDDNTPTLIGLRQLDIEGRFAFLVPIGTYTLAAFEDLNGDRIYQPGEPAARINNPPLYALHRHPDSEFDAELIETAHFSLSDQVALDIPMDFSLGALTDASVAAQRENFLTLTSLDNPRFSDEITARGLWEPMWFEENIHYGLYWLAPYDENKPIVLLVHGINGSPRNFEHLIDELDNDHQALVFHYPSGFPLDHTAYLLSVALSRLLDLYPEQTVTVLAHSMGGLISKDVLTYLTAEEEDKISSYITLATPWQGHAGAALGVKFSPTVAPVWYSMSPKSQYIHRLLNKRLSPDIDHHLFFTYSKKLNGPAASNDGVVSVGSQLSAYTRRDITALYAVNDNHNGVLNNTCVNARLKAILKDPSRRATEDDTNCERAVVEDEESRDHPEEAPAN